MTMNRNLDLFKAFADRTRLRLLHLLAHRGPEVCVCDMMSVLEMPQSTVSRQIAPMRILGLVSGRRAGIWIYYSLAEAADEFHKSLLTALRHCGHGDSELQEDLARYDKLIEKRRLACCKSSANGASSNGQKFKIPKSTNPRAKKERVR